MLSLQRVLGHLFVLPLGAIIIYLLRFRRRYTISNLKEIRKQFKEIVSSGEPLLVCSNHLTMIDSVILQWAFASLPWYFLHYRCFCWNIPAVEHARSKLSWRIITFVTKCILIDRQGSVGHIKQTFKKICQCVKRGDLFMIFPEGTRSRTGRVVTEDITYGIGKVVQRVPNCKILCVYLRGHNQEHYSTFPPHGARFSIALTPITPTSTHTGLRATRDYSLQAATTLKKMEEDYFAGLNRK